MLVIYFSSVILQLILTFKYFWRIKSILALGSLISFGFASSYFFFTQPNPFTFGEFFLAIYIVINLARIFAGKSNEQYLYKTSRLTTLLLVPIQLFLVVNKDIDINADAYLVFGVLASIFAVAALVEIIKNLSKQSRPSPPIITDLDKLPTITVAIPARNETKELFDCLTSVVASDYPKLEVIVLDDCSQDKTADIVKQFAQSGVRFVKGEEPDMDWLPKNQAYERLVGESSGEYILFLSADIRIRPDSISKLVSRSIAKHKSMISVEPLQQASNLQTKLFMPLQNWWEIVTPRVLFNRPATSSSMWLINKKQLIMLGGFRAVSRAVFPERFFAQKFILHNAYTYLLSTDGLASESSKQLSEVLSRTVRTKYPVFHRRLELVGLTSLLYVIVIFYPIYGLIHSLIYGGSTTTIVCAVAVIILNIANGLLLNKSQIKRSVVLNVSFVTSAVVDWLLINISALKYEFGTVNWKDRNICLPVMHRASQRVATGVPVVVEGADKLGI